MNDFNVLTFNGKAFPAHRAAGRRDAASACASASATSGRWITTRSTCTAYSFEVVGDRRRRRPAVRAPPGDHGARARSARTRIDRVHRRREPGDWAMHCHMTHHVMNQMGHDVANMVGADTRALDAALEPRRPRLHDDGHDRHGRDGEMRDADAAEQPSRCAAATGPFGDIDMGGMFTVLKVRDDPGSADAEGWFRHPEGTVAGPADAARLAADGIAP